jgi:hypothetical protein
MAYRRRFRKKQETIDNAKTKVKKYRNKEVYIDGIKFDSQKEGDRYLFLRKCEDSGLITDLELQPKFELIPSVKEDYIVHLKTKDKVKTRTVQLAINYKADFRYKKNGVEVVEDVKASPKMLTKEFELKFKLFFWRFGQRIRLVYKANEEV